MYEMLTILSYDLVGGARQLAADLSLSAVLQNPPICGQNGRQNQVSTKRIHTYHYQNTKQKKYVGYVTVTEALILKMLVFKDSVQGQGQELG